MLGHDPPDRWPQWPLGGAGHSVEVMLKRCQNWNAVAHVSTGIEQDVTHPGYYRVTILHRHSGDDEVLSEEYGAVTWREAQSFVDVATEAHRPGFRHTWLQAVQDRLFG